MRRKWLEFDQDAADEVCARLMDGQSLRAICRDELLPSERTVFNWLSQNETFVQQYARARGVQADVMFDEMHDIADTPVVGVKTTSKPTGVETTEGDMIDHRRMQIVTRKWMLGKMAPKKYGDKTQIEHSGTVGFDLSRMPDGDLKQLERILARTPLVGGGPERT